MLRLYAVVPALACLCLVATGCGGSSSREEAIPEGVAATQESGEEEVVERELTPEERAELERQQAAEAERKAQPSPCPGLTVGEFEAQPAFERSLPEHFDLGTTREDVRDHAAIVALEEQAIGRFGEGDAVTVANRATYITWRWMPQLEARQEVMQAALDKRKALAGFEQRAAKARADWRRKDEAQEREYDELVRAEQRKLVPPLTPEQQEELRRISEQERRKQR